ncbi:efflux RND transporter periplasmic adaptor subunit [Desulfobacca acetoxidans]|uniref:Efflux transporter, RND family, MFP subunit n=1 Tax=Desulfobacca acetoxidans (strain ATCC 700848 / DSM 11109 / ASRB2) TaxID=880072 RepID=F2NFT6_DESAR|nr:efflux RND transporter periplasmic adaptor subunit [Desulfobacca acetoxidans]AEB10205.1 efflux transporter, RND family, MFP subunit [Desulfobacca acetoxidans DSM 11109]
MDRYHIVLSPGVAVHFLAAISLSACMLSGCGEKKAAGPAVPTVEVVNVAQKDVPIFREWVGTTDGLVNAKINAQVQGYLIKQNYQEGSVVKNGQVLFEIDPRPFQAALEQAKGQLAINEGQLYTAKANLDKIRPLAAVSAVSKKDLDDAIGREASARAAVQAAKAAVRKAEIDLSFTKITSPIDGIAGIAKAQLGELVGNPGGPELTTVSTVDPIKVYIPLSEQEYLHYIKEGEAKEISDRETPKLELVLADGKVFPHKGKVFFADRQVDERTGTIKVATLFPNPGNILRPGQFAKIKALIDTQEGALLVPQRAVIELQGKFQVAVVGPDNKVDLRWVKVGERAGPLWVIDEGLKPGENVIVEGIQKVKAGMPVSPKPHQEASAGAQDLPAGKQER